MEFDTSFWMMFAFIIFMILGVWKIWTFLPTRQLEDDDTTEASQEELIALMLDTIKVHQGNLTEDALLLAMQKSDKFNAKHYWRFNLNKLKQLLQKFYIQHSNVSTIKEIYKEILCK